MDVAIKESTLSIDRFGKGDPVLIKRTLVSFGCRDGNQTLTINAVVLVMIAHTYGTADSYDEKKCSLVDLPRRQNQR